MTQLLVAGGLGRVFSSNTQFAVYQKFLVRQQEEERTRRGRKEDIADDADAVLDFALAVISTSEASTLRYELETYGTGAVAALQVNEEELSLSRDRLNTMLARAYVLPDGRRVFKTEDGTQVFDENGVELDQDTIAPDMIADSYQRWEPYWAEKTHFMALERQRTEILEYQEKLDAAQERLDSGTMTRKEFDELREELRTEMPEAVRAQIPEMEPEAAQNHAAVPAEELEFSEDIVPTAQAFANVLKPS